MDHLPAIQPNWHGWLEARCPRFLLFARSQTRSEADAHDLMQEVLVEIWRREPRRLPDDALVFKMLRRRAVDLGRRTDSRTRRHQEATAWWQLTPGEEACGDGELMRVLQGLPDRFREIVLLKIWSKLTFREIADALGLPQGTVASRYRSALEQMRGALKEAQP